MNLLEFINFKKVSPVTVLVAEQYPASCVTWLLAHHPLMSHCQPLDLETLDIESVRSQLQQSFLGQSRSYWLRNISELPDAVRTNLMSLLRTYDGPHTLFLCLTTSDSSHVVKSWHRVDIMHELDRTTSMQLLVQAGGLDQVYAAYITQLLFTMRPTIGLDQLFGIQPYFSVVHRTQITHFLNEWLDILMPSESSLFTLSKLFFEKNDREFFVQWSRIYPQYSAQFWHIYWAEQLWRASWYITVSRQKNKADLKKLSYRLPFTFVQHGWRMVSVRELKAAHDFIYGLDYATKHGGGTIGLELFFTQFFEGKF